MVKGRRIQAGSSNLNDSEPKSKAPTVFFRAPTYKLISPDVFSVPTLSTQKVRSIENTSTWGQSRVEPRDYQSIHSSTFKDPSTYEEHERLGIWKPLAEVEVDHEKNAAFANAMQKLCTLSKKTYGTTSALLRSVRLSRLLFPFCNLKCFL